MEGHDLRTRSVTRWGIVGTGAVAQSFAQDLKLLPQAELAAVSSRTPERARLFAEQFGARRAHATLEQLASDPEVDVVYVATPHVHHREHAVACLDVGKAVLCEKPLSHTATDALRIVERARSARRFCMEAMWMRFHPLIRTVKSMVEAGEIGTIRMLTADFGYPVPLDSRGRFFDVAAAGGALLDRGVYPISLAQLLLGAPEEVTGRATMASTGVDEQNALTFTYRSGALAVLSSSLRSRLRNEALIVGTRGEIRIHEPFYAPHRVSVRHFEEPAASASGDSIDAGGWKTRVRGHPAVKRAIETVARPLLRDLRGVSRQSHYGPGQGYRFEAEEVMRCLRAGELESPLMTLDDSVAIARITDTLRRSWGLRYPGESG